MRLIVIAVVLGLGSAAAAQPGTTEAGVPLIDKLLASGQIAARAGNCHTAATIGSRVAELDPDFHARVYAVDPVIAGCQEGVDTRPHPPGLASPLPEPELGYERPAEDQKSESLALGLSLGGTLASYALIGASIYTAEHGDDGDTAAGLWVAGSVGAMFAPSLGHWYAGTIGTPGLGLRAGGAGVVLIGAVVAFSQCPLFAAEDECDDTTAAGAIMIGGLGMIVGGAVLDIATAQRRVRDYNQRGGLRSFAVVPQVQRHGGGLAVAGAF